MISTRKSFKCTEKVRISMLIWLWPKVKLCRRIGWFCRCIRLTCDVSSANRIRNRNSTVILNNHYSITIQSLFNLKNYVLSKNMCYFFIQSRQKEIQVINQINFFKTKQKNNFFGSFVEAILKQHHSKHCRSVVSWRNSCASSEESPIVQSVTISRDRFLPADSSKAEPKLWNAWCNGNEPVRRRLDGRWDLNKSQINVPFCKCF